MSARETVNRVVAAAHVLGDGTPQAQYGFGSITRVGVGTYEFTADGIQKEVFQAGEDVILVSSRDTGGFGAYVIALVETLFPGGVVQVLMLSNDGKTLTDGAFDIVITNAQGAF